MEGTGPRTQVPGVPGSSPDEIFFFFFFFFFFAVSIGISPPYLAYAHGIFNKTASWVGGHTLRESEKSKINGIIHNLIHDISKLFHFFFFFGNRIVVQV